ncbi:MAG: hypothetical protein ACJAZ2_000157 [Glaciecola sp.]
MNFFIGGPNKVLLPVFFFAFLVSINAQLDGSISLKPCAGVLNSTCVIHKSEQVKTEKIAPVNTCLKLIQKLCEAKFILEVKRDSTMC